MAFDINELTPEQIQKGLACKSLDEFQSFVKDEGFDLDEAEAQAIFEEMYEMELSDKDLEAVAGGTSWGCKEYTCERYRDYRTSRKK